MKLNSEIGAVLADDALTLAILQDRELSPEVLAGLKEIAFPGNLGLLPIDDKSRKAYKMMEEVVMSFPSTFNAAFMDDLAADFAAIYLTGAFGASPYESYWLSDDHLICQDAMFDLRELYAGSGLAAPDWRKRPDDHLVFQLHFLSLQITKANKNEDWQSLAAFLDYHLLRWLPDFAGRVVSHCDTPFYAALIFLTDVWCHQLRTLIEWHLGEDRLTAEEIEESLRARRKTEVQEFPLHFVPGAGGPSW